VGIGFLRAAEACERLGRTHLPLLNVGSAGKRFSGSAQHCYARFRITVELG
jgi:hypothetical protein